jgi:hypothetical protein
MIGTFRKHSHASQLIAQLSRSERNALRVILLKRDGLSELREALGVQHMQIKPVSVAETYADILPLDR